MILQTSIANEPEHTATWQSPLIQEEAYLEEDLADVLFEQLDHLIPLPDHEGGRFERVEPFH